MMFNCFLFFCIVVRLAEISCEDEVCYDKLGCFPLGSPWRTPTRPVPPPQSPQEINSQIIFYTRATANQGKKVQMWPEIDTQSIGFNPSKPTVFVTHGFLTDAQFPWMIDIRHAFLKAEDCNVFIIDWSGGALELDYFQVSSNTRIVGAELGRLGKHLIDHNKANAANFTMVGHSLGAHVMGYAGRILKNVFRIIAIDPAKPLFENHDEIVKVDKDDASFLEVYHTTGHNFLPFFRIGFVRPAGNVDYYINGASWQPDCLHVRYDVVMKPTNPLADILLNIFYNIICQHHRGITLLINSLEGNCTFIGHKEECKVKFWEKYSRYVSKDQNGIEFDRKCTKESCIPLGLDAPSYPARGNFYVSTTNKEPYCAK